MRILAAGAWLALLLAGCGHQAQSAPVTGTPDQRRRRGEPGHRGAGQARSAGRRVLLVRHRSARLYRFGAAFGGRQLGADRGALPERRRPGQVRSRFRPRSSAGGRVGGRSAVFGPTMAGRQGSDGGLRHCAGGPPGGRIDRGGGRLGADAGQPAGARHRGDRDRLSRGGRRVAGRLSGQHRAQRQRISRVAVRGLGGRHQRRAVDQRLERDRCDRRPARRRLRGGSVLLSAVRLEHHRLFARAEAAGPGDTPPGGFDDQC